MKFSTVQFDDCYCRSVGECPHHVADPEGLALKAMVDAFSQELLDKLMQKREEGKGGWDDPNWPLADIFRQMRSHIDKGDMRDVAAFAMFAWNRADHG